MSALNRLHFEDGASASLRETVLRAAETAGLDRDAAVAFLDSDELEDEVKRSGWLNALHMFPQSYIVRCARPTCRYMRSLLTYVHGRHPLFHPRCGARMGTLSARAAFSRSRSSPSGKRKP